MMTLVLLLLAALIAVPVMAQPAPLECPLPPYQLPLQTPPRSTVDSQGQVFVDGADTPLDLDGLTATETLWSDDGEILLIAANSPDYESHVFAYRDGELTGALGGETLFRMRTEDFRKAVQIFNPAFIPGTHTVLFNTRVITDGEGIYEEVPSDLWSLDLDAIEPRELLPFGEGGHFSISPDGETVLLMNFDQIWTTDTNGENPVVLYEGAVGMGLGHTVDYPEAVWDTDADGNTVVRVLLFPDFDANNSIADIPYEIHEFTLTGEPTSRVLLTAPADIFYAVALSPDGYHAAEWRWLDDANPVEAEIVVDGAETALVTFEVPTGMTPFVAWDDTTHIRYGYGSFETGERAEWRVDLCGEVTPLETTAGIVSPDGTHAAFIVWMMPQNNEI